MERSGVYWRGRVTGRKLLLGEGGGRHGKWCFRADDRSWALVFKRDCIRGLKGVLDVPLTPESAWVLIASHMDGPLPARLGPCNTAPLTVMRHPEYGDLPHTAGPGAALPPGAVRADPKRQTPGMWPVRYFYVDSDHTCVQCGTDFVLGAAEQRYWYEDAGLSFDVRPVRCTRCRRERRAVKRLHAAVAEARAAVGDTPVDAAARLSLAVALVRLNEDRDEGDLGVAVAAARRALALDTTTHGAHYWLARAHELAGRAGSAMTAYGEFLAAAQGTRDPSRRLLDDAARRRAALRTARE
ncbi:zinc-ribbon domain containing protein [Phytomonospora endophytica]|uniref:Probable zinc-binding domain-containing protein n=1 Tax=Phytomonospora endophytica TaxID=714109 RepID=A0A841FU13_9ACTN|nr:zinc-ribbon domain containing protein [Phytomonospora endophytica]MBB6036827.1 hypothetical protein [Phytomonospora endophytica]